jgi:LAO/AO transport system kinase
MKAIKSNSDEGRNKQMHLQLLTEKAWQLLIHKKMKDVNKAQLKRQIEAGVGNRDFNLYSFVEHYQ